MPVWVDKPDLACLVCGVPPCPTRISATIRDDASLHSQAHPTIIGMAASLLVPCGEGALTRRRRNRMPLRQTIGISLAILMASAGAMAKTPDKSAAYQSSTPPNADPGRSANRSAKSRAVHRAAHFRWPHRLAFHHGGKSRYRDSVSIGSRSDPNWGPMHTTGYQEIGQAAWYDLVGNRTSSGERLDTDTPTAAHRSLPLGSCAKVTSLDTGRSVIVKINDRGPYSRRFISICRRGPPRSSV